MTVSDLDQALAFWESLLGVEGQRMRVEMAEQGQIVGFPQIQSDAAFVPLPGGQLLELLDYDIDKPAAIDADETRAPGHVHVALEVDDINEVLARARELGARSVSPNPITIADGPFKGVKGCYIRIPPDGQTIELYQPAPSGG
jgi:catechol 2,3-dioxygenase-like lactoylglutathione lyase family enzyme